MAISMHPALPASVNSLSWKETLELFKRLSPKGTVGFNYGDYRLRELRDVLVSWLPSASAPYATQDALASTIIASRASAAPKPFPAAPAPSAARVLPPAPGVPDAAEAPSAAEAAAATAYEPGQHVDPMIESAADALAALERQAAVMRAAIATQQAVTQPFANLPLHAAPQPLPPAPDSFVSRDEQGAPGDLMTQEEADARRAAAVQAQAAQAAPLAPSAASAAPTWQGHVLAREVFKDQPQRVLDAIPANLTIPVYKHADAEPIDYTYKFQPETLTDALIAMHQSPTVRIWCGGPRGTGKSEFVRALASRTGRAFFRVALHRFSEAADLVGDMGLLNGSTVYQDGPVTKAVRIGEEAMLLIDELTYGSAGAMACLNPILEQRGAPLRLKTGEALSIPPGLFIAVADNTFGAGNDSSEYIARNELGADLRDRFGYKLAFDYLPEADERELLRDAIAKATGRKPSAAAMKPIMQLLKTCRAQSEAGELQGAPSFRGAVSFATLLAFGKKPADAWRTTVILGAPESSHEKLRLVFASLWPVDSTGSMQTFQGEI